MLEWHGTEACSGHLIPVSDMFEESSKMTKEDIESVCTFPPLTAVRTATLPIPLVTHAVSHSPDPPSYLFPSPKSFTLTSLRLTDFNTRLALQRRSSSRQRYLEG